MPVYYPTGVLSGGVGVASPPCAKEWRDTTGWIARMARRLLTIKEAAVLVHRAPLTVRRAIEAGKVPGARRVPIPGSRVSAPWMVSVEGLFAAGFVVDERAAGERAHEGGSALGAPAGDIERLRLALANAEGRIVGLESAMAALVDLLREVRRHG